MTEKLGEKLASLRAIAPKLNRATDAAIKTIADVDAFLYELSLGVPGSHRFAQRTEASPGPGEPRLAVYSYLVYGRLRGKFQIHIAENTWSVDDDGDNDRLVDETLMAWSEASRDVKLDSFSVLPDLIEHIESNAREKAEKADRSGNRVREALHAMNPPSPPHTDTDVATDVLVGPPIKRKR